jgi:MFS transporter, SP family, arabinose:H+ symporter
MKNRINLTLVQSTLIGALGGLLFGFDTAVIAGVVNAVRTVFHLTPLQVGITVSSALWGTVIGAVFSGMVGEHLGGRESLRILAGCYVVSAVGCAFAPGWYFLLFARFIGGLGIGGSSVLGPVYIAEISPPRWRGRMVGSFQINIVVGVLAAYLSNYLIGKANMGAHEWRWDLGVAAFPAILFFILLFTIPASPRWLVAKGHIPQAELVLRKLGSESPEAELRDIVASLQSVSAEHTESLFQLKYRYPIFLAVSIAMFNQLTGINAIIYYLNDIFSMAGFGKLSSAFQAVVIGAMNLLSTLLAMTVIDRLGRKKLLLYGSVGMTVALAAVARIFSTHRDQKMLLSFLCLYIVSFAISQGSVIWVFLSEIFPNRVRSRGQSLGSATHWIMNAIIALVFPLLATRSAAYPFELFTAMVVLQFFVVLLWYPETRGESLEGIERKLGIDMHANV